MMLPGRETRHSERGLQAAKLDWNPHVLGEEEVLVSSTPILVTDILMSLNHEVPGRQESCSGVGILGHSSELLSDHWA